MTHLIERNEECCQVSTALNDNAGEVGTGGGEIT